jgi:hypothetical protein
MEVVEHAGRAAASAVGARTDKMERDTDSFIVTMISDERWWTIARVNFVD